MRAFRSYNDPDGIILIDQVIDIKPKMFIGKNVFHQKIDATVRFIDDDKISLNNFEPKRVTLTAVANEKQGEEAELSHVIHEEALYNEINIPNSTLEMLSGTDNTAIVLAYDLLMQHCTELTGSIFQ